MKKLKIAIVGMGRIGQKHADNLVNKVAGCEVVAACVPDPEQQLYARETLGIEKVFEDYATLLNETDAEAVFLVTPTTSHADQIIAALQVGKHVFCEKPVALNVEDCRRVEQAAAQYPELIVFIGFVRRWDPTYVEAKRRIDAGEIGVLYRVSSQTADMDEWAAFQIDGVPKSGGIFMDMGIHDVDLVHWLTGQTFEEVFAVGGAYEHKGFEAVDDADNVSALCRLSGGAMANINVSRTAVHGHDTQTEIHGTKGSLLIGQNPSENRLVIKDTHGVRNTCVQEFFARFSEAFLLEAEDFVHCCQTGTQPRISLAEARRATEVSMALRESFIAKSSVKLQLG